MTTTERLARFETAQEVLGFLMAGYSALLWKERAKPNPDAASILKWETEKNAYFDIEASLRMEDSECIERVITVYGPKARAMFATKQDADQHAPAGQMQRA